MKKIKQKLILIIILVFLLSLTGLTQVGAEELTITGNGAGSSNEIIITNQTTTTVQQNNEANVNNNVQTEANTGDNSASDNTSGSINITTGDVDSQTNTENQANVSQVDNQCCPTQGTSATISGNGTDSQNKIDINSTNPTDVTVNQTATIKNEVNGRANTGNNETNNNGGNTTIDTGNITTQADINNHDINMAKVAVGQGGPEVTINISDNGAESENNVDVDQSNEIAVQIDNVASIANYLNWDLNTGNNFASGNLGDVAIFTGDIISNLNIDNGPINSSEVIISCCEVTPTPTPNPTPTPTPTTPGGGGEDGESGGGGGSSSSSSSSGGVGGAAAAGEVLAAATGEVLPIAGTNSLFFLTLASILMFVSGLYLRHATSSISKNYSPNR
ncbi:hypothetical protein HY385_00620 [Candidatus Daviesbacteria bacterium]|nr:hypothetical protein [Candidatus Daviesbacteria bacterium]